MNPNQRVEERKCLNITNLYFVPKAVVLGDAKSVCTDDILDEGPILHHTITAKKHAPQGK